MDMVKQVKFLIFVDKEEEESWNEVIFTYKPYYYCLTKERSNPDIPYSQQKAITTQESGFDEMVDLIVRDWIILQIGKREDYVLGLSWCTPVPTVFTNKRSMESFRNLIKGVISDKFDDEFVNKCKTNSTQYLFNLLVNIENESCELVSSEIEEYDIKKTIEDDLNFTAGCNEVEIPAKTSTIQFIIKTIPRISEDPFDSFAFAYNRHGQACIRDEIHDTPSLFLDSGWKGSYEDFACCGWAVEDWVQSQLIQRENYILGLGLDESLITVVHREKIFFDILDKLQAFVHNKFDDKFIKEFDGKPHAFLFKFEVFYNFDEAKILSSSVADIIDSEEPSFKDFPIPRRKLLDCFPKDFNQEDL